MVEPVEKLLDASDPGVIRLKLGPSQELFLAKSA
jgi:hypothetical protein